MGPHTNGKRKWKKRERKTETVGNEWLIDVGHHLMAVNGRLQMSRSSSLMAVDSRRRWRHFRFVDVALWRVEWRHLGSRPVNHIRLETNLYLTSSNPAWHICLPSSPAGGRLISCLRDQTFTVSKLPKQLTILWQCHERYKRFNKGWHHETKTDQEFGNCWDGRPWLDLFRCLATIHLRYTHKQTHNTD